MSRIPNSPYLRLDIAGRLIVNAYRTADHRRVGGNPLIQRIDERGRFDTARGIFAHVGKVGIYAALHGNGPARKATS